MARSLVLNIGAILIILMAPLADAAEADADSQDWTRMSRVEPNTSRLDIAVRFYEPAEGDGPTVALVGAIHIADATYYTAVQAILDGQDLVLFEGVGGPEMKGIEPGSDAERKLRTERRLQYLNTMAARYAKQVGEHPRSLDDLIGAGQSVFDATSARMILASSSDAWSGRVGVEIKDEKPVGLISYGADGKPGGEGMDSDLRVAFVAGNDAGAGQDLYGTIADGLGLTSQAERVLTDQPGWINSDMRWDELRERFGNDNAVFNFLDGAAFGGGEQSQLFMATIQQTLSSNPNMRVMLKNMMINMLGQKMPDIGAIAGEDFRQVIVHDRNQVVVDDLKQAIKNNPDLGSVALFYGAAHMPDMEKRLIDQLGYRATTGFWLPAITVDPRQEAAKAKVK